MIVLKGIKIKGLTNNIIKKKDPSDPLKEGGSLDRTSDVHSYIKPVPAQAPQQDYFDNLEVTYKKITEDQMDKINNLHFKQKKNKGVKLTLK